MQSPVDATAVAVRSPGGTSQHASNPTDSDDTEVELAESELDPDTDEPERESELEEPERESELEELDEPDCDSDDELDDSDELDELDDEPQHGQSGKNFSSATALAHREV